MAKNLWRGCFLMAVSMLVVLLAWMYASLELLPHRVWAALRHADQVELLSILPYDEGELSPTFHGPPKPNFHGHPILGATLLDGDEKDQLLNSLRWGLAANQTSEMMCFHPRHGVRVLYDGQTYDLVICFDPATIDQCMRDALSCRTIRSC
jgi:hypothetical protein